MDTDTLVGECRELAAAYVVATEAQGRALARDPSNHNPPEVRAARDAFERLLNGCHALDDAGREDLSKQILMEALSAGTKLSQEAQREELARLVVA